MPDRVSEIDQRITLRLNLEEVIAALTITESACNSVFNSYGIHGMPPSFYHAVNKLKEMLNDAQTPRTGTDGSSGTGRDRSDSNNG
jgi:hypothetical protein